MKKLLLSSIIMLGVCGIVSAQNATESKLKKNAEAKQNTEAKQNAAALTPQKAAVAEQKPVLTNADGTVAALTADDVSTPAEAKAPQSDVDAYKQKEAQKAAGAKPATGKKTKDN